MTFGEDEQPHFQYRLADHLGNTVVLFEDRDEDGIISSSLADPATAEVLQRELYYPFGLPLRGTAPLAPEPSQDYLYNGKEDVWEIGLLDYGARMYDPAAGRWLGVDPLAGEYGAFSPYNYVLNNPMLLVDPDGREPCPPGQDCGGASWAGYDFYTRTIEKGKQFTYKIFRTADQLIGNVLSYTDVNDVFVLSSAAVGAPSNTDGTKADGLDIGMAAGGIFLPYVGGSAVKKGGGKVIEFIATEFDAQDARKVDAIANELKTATNQDEFNKMIMGKSGPIRVIEDNGAFIIDDGHHRLKAADKANTGFSVPVQVTPIEETRFKTIQTARDATRERY